MTQLITVRDGRVCGFHTTAEFAEKCGVEPVTVRQWIRRNKIPSVRIGSDNYIPLGTEKPGRSKRGEGRISPNPFFETHPQYKYYWRVVIGLKNVDPSPRFDVAGYFKENLAKDCIERIRQSERWDDDAMYAMPMLTVLPPMTMDPANIEEKIECLKLICNFKTSE